jgi:hypothetical protein
VRKEKKTTKHKKKSYKNCYDVRNTNIIYESWLRARNKQEEDEEKKSEGRDQVIKQIVQGMFSHKF